MRHGYTIHGALSHAWVAWRRNIVPVATLLLLSHLPIMYYLRGTDETGPWPLLAVGLGLAAITPALLAAMLAKRVAAQVHNQAVSLSASFAQFRRHLGHALATALVTLLAVGLGSTFLLIPGMILGVILLPCLPIAVLEGQGPLQAWRRSAALTRGNRWGVFGLFAIVLGGLVFVAQFAVPIMEVMNVDSSTILDMLLGAQLIIISWAVHLPAVVYALLQREQAGTNLDAYVDIFA